MTTFGVHCGLEKADVGELVDKWRGIESLGFDWISVWDHLYGTQTGFQCLDAVVCHTLLASSTSRVRCAVLVYCVAYRSVAILAKTATTVDHVSRGRAEIGLGAGWHKREHQSFGLPFLDARERLGRLEEAAAALPRLLRGEAVDAEGNFVSLTGAACEPRPVQDRLPVWIGGNGRRCTLQIAARYGDGWNGVYLSPEDLAQRMADLRRYAEKSGRDPSSISTSVNLGLASSDADVEARFSGSPPAIMRGVLTGTPRQMVDRMCDYLETGVDRINVAMREPWQLHELAELVDHLDAKGLWPGE